jgi:hypothetical protein
LLRHKLVADEAAAVDAGTMIWGELTLVMPAKLAEKWSHGSVSFRDLLREGVHEACYSWSKPAMRPLISSEPDDDKAWKDEARPDLLSKARERLKSYQREHEGRGNLYYAIFRLWDEHREESLDALNARLAALPGGRRLDPPAFRKTLGRARDLFGKYLFEEVAAWIAERDVPSPEKYIQTFEELDIMDDYANHSKNCRWLLGMEEEEEDEE